MTYLVFEVTFFISYDKQFDNWDTKQKKPTMLVREGINKVKKIIFIRYKGGGGEKFTIISDSTNEPSE